METEGCTLNGNLGCGASAGGDSTLMEVRGCCSIMNAGGDYVTLLGRQMMFRNSSSDSDMNLLGGAVAQTAQLIMEQVTVDGVVQSEQLP